MQLNASEIAAWWGAIIASIVLLWDIFKWMHRGAKVLVTASPNMQTVNHHRGGLDEEKYIFVEAINVGEAPTTITHLVSYQYKTIFHRLLGKPEHTGVTIKQGTGIELPHLLEVGARWTGMIDQEDLISKIGNNGLTYCSIAHTGKRNSILKRVKL